MSGKTTVIFDFDGTLANSVDLMLQLYNSHAEEFGYLPIKKSEFPELRILGYRKAMKLKRVKMRKVPKMIMKLGKEMRQNMNEVKPYDGIVKVLKELKKSGFAIGILTSNQVELVSDFLKVHKFPEFDFLVSEKTLFGKDKALKRIMKRYSLEPGRVIYVGDEPRDVAASKKAKIRVVAVTWGLGGFEAFEKDRPDVLVSTPAKLFKSIIDFS